MKPAQMNFCPFLNSSDNVPAVFAARLWTLLPVYSSLYDCLSFKHTLLSVFCTSVSAPVRAGHQSTTTLVVFAVWLQVSAGCFPRKQQHPPEVQRGHKPCSSHPRWSLAPPTTASFTGLCQLELIKPQKQSINFAGINCFTAHRASEPHFACLSSGMLSNDIQPALEPQNVDNFKAIPWPRRKIFLSQVWERVNFNPPASWWFKDLYVITDFTGTPSSSFVSSSCNLRQQRTLWLGPLA